MYGAVMRFWKKPDGLGRATRDGSSADPGAAPSAAPMASDHPTGSLAAIRSQIAGESLRAILTELHGPEEGEKLFAAAVQSRETAERREELEAQLADAWIASAAEIAEAERALEDLERGAAFARGQLAAALDQVGSQWTRLQELRT